MEANTQWPMNKLTKATGSTRKLIVKPVNAVSRAYIGRDARGNPCITGDASKIKVPPGTYYCEDKEQGHFYIYARDYYGNYTMYSRRIGVSGSYTNIYPKLKGKTELPSLPLKTAVAVELVYPGHPDSSVPTGIKECPQNLRAIAHGLAIYMGAVCMDQKILYMNSRKILEKIFGSRNCVRYFKLKLEKETTVSRVNTLLRSAEHRGIEGFVLKEYAYKNWFKIKRVQEADVFVTGFKISNSQTYDGQVTALLIGVLDRNKKVIPMGSVSGLNDELKQEISKSIEFRGYNFDEVLGPKFLRKVLRVTYQEVASKGKLKHGFFDGWRDDKDWTECTMDQF